MHTPLPSSTSSPPTFADAQADAFVSSRARTRGQSWPLRLFGWLSSVWAAATQIAIVTIVIAVATVYERDYGRDVAAVMIYQSTWFATLFALMAMTVFGAAAVRWPWRRHQYGFVVVHVGLLLSIAGFFAAGNHRLDGMLEAVPGQKAARLDLPSDAVTVVDGETRLASPPFQPTAFAGYPSFARYLLSPMWPVPAPGVVTLPAHRAGVFERLARDASTLALLDGPGQPLLLDPTRRLSVRALALVDTGRPELGFAEVAAGAVSAGVSAQPAVLLDLHGRFPGMAAGALMPLQRRWLTPDADSVAELGPVVASLTRTDSAAFAADFAATNTDLGTRGRLGVYWHGQRYWLDLDALADGTEQVLADDLSLRIRRLVLRPSFAGEAAHEPAALSEPKDSEDKPLSPLLLLDLGVGSIATRQWLPTGVAAFVLVPQNDARRPQLLFEHPALHATDPQAKGAYVQLLLTPDGSLQQRWFTRSRGLAGNVAITSTWQGDWVGGPQAPMQLNASVRVLAHALPAPEPIAMKPDAKDRAQRWLLLAVERDGARGQAWLRRGERAEIPLKNSAAKAAGRVLLAYGRAPYDLEQEQGFALRLDHFEHGKDPGGDSSATYASDVTVLPKDGQPFTAHISMNEPLTWRGVTIYQTAFAPETDAQGNETGRQISIFTVAADPGRWLKYAGAALLVAGMLLLFLLRKHPRKKSSDLGTA